MDKDLELSASILEWEMMLSLVDSNRMMNNTPLHFIGYPGTPGRPGTPGTPAVPAQPGKKQFIIQIHFYINN